MSTMSASNLEQAHQLYRSGNLTEARQAVESILKTEPNNIDALLLAAEIYRAQNPKIAFQVYARVAQLAPQRPEAPAGLALLYHEQGDPARCDRALDATIDLDPEYLRARYYSGMAAAAQAAREQGASARDKMVDFYDSIAAAYQRAVERHAISPLVAFNLGRVLFVLGEPALARDAYKRALDLDPEMTEAYAGMAEASYALEEFEEAVGWCQLVEGRTWLVTGDLNDPNWVAARAAAGDLSLAGVYAVEAKAHLWMGQFEEMTQALRRAAEMEPWNSGNLYRSMLDEHVRLGRALLENNQLPEARQVLEVGRDLAERMEYHALFLWLAEAYLAQALIHHQAKERKEAEAWLERARELVNRPPVNIPADARADWDNLKSRLTLGDKPSPFGFLKR